MSRYAVSLLVHESGSKGSTVEKIIVGDVGAKNANEAKLEAIKAAIGFDVIKTLAVTKNDPVDSI